MFRLPVGIAKHIIKLLQSRNKNFPELPKNLGIPVVAFLLQGLGESIQPGFQVYILQERIQCQDLIP